jgi:Tfp pilus assembly protein PilW
MRRRLLIAGLIGLVLVLAALGLVLDAGRRLRLVTA